MGLMQLATELYHAWDLGARQGQVDSEYDFKREVFSAVRYPLDIPIVLNSVPNVDPSEMRMMEGIIADRPSGFAGMIYDFSRSFYRGA